MIHSFLIGLAGGMRSMTPLAAISIAANSGALPDDNGAPRLLGHPVVTAGLVGLAAGELLADKHPASPDRIIPPGIAARLVTGAVTGMALASKSRRLDAAMLGALGALASAYLTFDARIGAMRRYGQVSTGLVEDALTLATTAAIVSTAGSAERR